MSPQKKLLLTTESAGTNCYKGPEIWHVIYSELCKSQDFYLLYYVKRGVNLTSDIWINISLILRPLLLLMGQLMPSTTVPEGHIPLYLWHISHSEPDKTVTYSFVSFDVSSLQNLEENQLSNISYMSPPSEISLLPCSTKINWI